MQTSLSLIVTGKVQGVMFRQTIIRAAQKRGLLAGTTNLNSGDEVSITLQGEGKLVQEIVDGLNKKESINSWGATPDNIVTLEEVIPITEHQVTTDNVDSFNWTPGVEFYL